MAKALTILGSIFQMDWTAHQPIFKG